MGPTAGKSGLGGAGRGRDGRTTPYRDPPLPRSLPIHYQARAVCLVPPSRHCEEGGRRPTDEATPYPRNSVWLVAKNPPGEKQALFDRGAGLRARALLVGWLDGDVAKNEVLEALDERALANPR